MNDTPSNPRLLVDAGNTRIKVGLFDSAPIEPGALPVCHRAWAIPADQPFPWSDIKTEIGKSATDLTSCVTGSNVTCVDAIHSTWPSDIPSPSTVPERNRFPIEIDVEAPERVGIDRLLNAVAVNQIRPAECAAIVIDSGTATTIDYVSSQGSFGGGAILPGFDLNARALHQYTDQLPLFALREMPESPPGDLGRNTEQAIRSGLYWGHVGAVKELVRRLFHRAAMESEENSDGRHLGNLHVDRVPLVVLTGGAAELLALHIGMGTQTEPHLTLQGLALVASM